MHESDKIHEQIRQDMLREHLSVDSRKPVSYLPIGTIEKFLGLSVDDYIRTAQERGHSAVVTAADRSPIKSGTVHLFDRAALQRILDQSSDALELANFPVLAADFVVAIGQNWLSSDHPIIHVVRQAFGDD